MGHKVVTTLQGGHQTEQSTTSLMVGEAKSDIKELKKELRALRVKFSPPRPDLTVFRLGDQGFHPYSTSEDEEELGSEYWVSLTSLFSAGKNIIQFLQSMDPALPDISFNRAEMYSLFPIVEEGIIYVGRIGPAAMFSIKSAKFPRDRLNPPEDAIWNDYEFERVKIFSEEQLDLLLGSDIGLYSQLAKVFRISYDSGVNKIRKYQKEGKNFAVYLLKTPSSKFSPYITMRVGVPNEKIKAHLFPTWFAYDELKLIRSARELQKVCQPFKRIIEY